MILEQSFNFIPADGSTPSVLRLTISDITRNEDNGWDIIFNLEGMMPEPRNISCPYPFQCIESAVFLLRNFLEAHSKIGSIKDIDGNDYHNALPFVNAKDAIPNISPAYAQYMQQNNITTGKFGQQ